MKNIKCILASRLKKCSIFQNHHLTLYQKTFFSEKIYENIVKFILSGQGNCLSQKQIKSLLLNIISLAPYMLAIAQIYIF